MPTRRQLIQKITLNADASSVTFSNIPQNYTDLLALTSVRTNFTGVNGVNDYILMRFNGDSGSNYTYRQLLGNGSVASSQSGTLTGALAGRASGSDATASTFGNSKTYMSNYTAATNKSLLTTAINENNGTSSAIAAQAALWLNTSAITSILFIPGDGSNFRSNSTFYLYGITHVPIIRGGEVTVPGDGFKYHTFRSSGSLQVVEPGDVEYLVVAGGGGGGGWTYGGGGGGGGVLSGRCRISNDIHPVIIGAGGVGSDSTDGNSGTSSSIITISTTGGGGGGGIGPRNGLPGGSGGGGGGGGGGASSQTNGGAGTSIQGNNGGGSYSESQRGAGGGGGGAGSVGGNGSQNLGGNGGSGRLLWGTYYAGGGGGATYNDFPSTPGNGGVGGGGIGGRNGVLPAGSGVSNTGGGGGGRGTTIGNGGSGIIIIRYPYDGN